MVNIALPRPPRAYRSAVRGRQAEQTRLSVLKAARRLFARDGYVDATIDAIAADAGVSPQTIYAVFGSKPAVLAALLESLVASVRLDEASAGAQTPEDQLRRCARIARRIYDALRDTLQAIRVAESLSGELSEIGRTGAAARFANLGRVIETLSSDGALAPNLDAAAALDLLWSLTGPEFYRLLVVERGWSAERYEADLGDLLVRVLLA